MKRHTWLSALLVAWMFLQPALSFMADEPAAEVEDVPNKSMDELIVDAANSSRQFDFFYDDNGNRSLVKVEFDMVFDPEEYSQLQASYDDETGGNRVKRTAGLRTGRWTNNVVPYQFANVFSSRDISQLNAGIGDWERYTCLDFRQSSSGNRIYFNNGGGCFSRVGMVGGAQTLGLARGCRTKGVIIHEIGHALGLHHEQTRPDRDEHVRILNQNIARGMGYNFQRNSWRTILNMGIPYDYTSIMHYGKTAFSTNGRLTIQTINPAYQNVIGNRHGLSFRDIKSINIMYNCKRHTRSCTKTDDQCPGEGFVGKDCRCWCPGGSLRNPTKSCTDTTTGGGTRTTRAPVTVRPTPRPTGCRDNHQNCAHWASRRECTINPAYMLNQCKLSCNVCNGEGGGGTRTRCRDLHFKCPIWRRYCTNSRYRRYMSTNCKSTCGLCSGRNPTPCADKSTQCPYWASVGHCYSGQHVTYMRQNCKASCQLCNVARDPAPVRTQNPNCRDQNAHCSFWAGTGQCAGNPGYMNFVCPFSCEVC